MKSFLISVFKWGAMILLFAFLFSRAAANGALRGFLGVQKDWRFLFLGFAAVFGAVLITFFRWRLLNNALGIPQTAASALRLGFIGYLFNFLPVGIVGGDVVKGIMLARRYPESKAACAASIVMDRVLGLYVMFLFGLGAAWATGFWQSTQPQARFAYHALLWLTAILTAGLLLLFFPSSGKDRRRRFFAAVPGAGSVLLRLYDAAARYRGQKSVLLRAGLETLAVHALLGTGIFFTALGLWGRAPSMADHFVIYPIANTGSMIPLSAGPFEFFLDQLYPLFPCAGGESYPLGAGLLVGVAYRFLTLAIAAIGGICFLVTRDSRLEPLASGTLFDTEGKTP